MINPLPVFLAKVELQKLIGLCLFSGWSWKFVLSGSWSYHCILTGTTYIIASTNLPLGFAPFSAHRAQRHRAPTPRPTGPPPRQALPFGDPSETTTAPRHHTEDLVVRAHGAVTLKARDRPGRGDRRGGRTPNKGPLEGFGSSLCATRASHLVGPNFRQLSTSCLL